jgi:hypothetical protein
MPQKLSFWRRWAFSRAAVIQPRVTFEEPCAEEELSAALAEPPVFDRRNARRHPCGVEISCQPIVLVRSEPWPVVLRDVSSTGVGLVLDYPVPPGTFVALEVPGWRKPLRAQVVAIRPHEDQMWVLGCTFVRELKADQLTALLAEVTG